jgi:hypothetical protein
VIEFDRTYPHSYEIEELRDIPGSGGLNVPLFYIPKPKGRLEHDGLWLKFHAARAKTWVGVFAYGYPSPPAFSRVFSSPDLDKAYVVANGRGFLVTPSAPEKCEVLAALPVLEVRSIPEHKMFVFADFTRLAAYGSSGLVWRSPRLCWDGLKITTVTRDTIEGTGYDPTAPGRSRFLVDLRTGDSLLPPPVSVDGTPLW